METPLAGSVKFRCLTDQLSQQEFVLFIKRMLDQNKANLIKTALFNHMMKSNNNECNDINGIISNIIRSRKSKPKPSPTSNIRFDHLPKSLIGHTAAYLDQSDYIRLGKVNRSIFIGCNAPNMMQQLDLFNITDYSSINLTHFSSLKVLQININQFNQFILPQNGPFIMNKLEELSLDLDFKKDCDIQPFMNQKCINIENIKTLNLKRFGYIGNINNRFNMVKFDRLLTKFPNIEYLELYNIFLSSHIDAEKLKKSYPNLKRLSVIGGYKTMSNLLVNAFGNDLHFLCHKFIPHPSTDFSNINFSKLEEIKLETPSIKTINDTLKTGKNLRKFQLLPSGYGKNPLSGEELKGIIPEILKCKLLQYLEIEGNATNYIAILDGIEAGLFATNELHRKTMKIGVNARNESCIDPNKMILNIGRIIHWMETSDINDFMFIWDLREINIECKDKVNKIQILNRLSGISPNIEVYADGLRFVITNKNCKMCGWEEKL